MTDYHRYMASREWRVRRRGIFDRCRGVCERCWGAKAVQAHHLTYERLGHERPEDLLALCRHCHEFLSAVTDRDPVASIPTLAGPDDGWMGEELSRLAHYEIRAKAQYAEAPTEEAEVVRDLMTWIAGHVCFWVVEAAKLFKSMPEGEYGIVHALGLQHNLERDEPEIAKAGLCVLEEIGLAVKGDEWRRWRVPLRWLEQAA